MPGSLEESLSSFRDRVGDCIRAGGSVLVTTHNDCDGLTSGSIITKALIRAGARCTVRTAREFSPAAAASLGRDPRDFNIITDLGGGFAKEVEAAAGGSWAILDHHQIPESEMDNPNVINAWRFGIDGGREVCAGGMAYLAAAALDAENEDLSAVAVVAALGDRQDRGERGSLEGRNFEIAETAKKAGLLEVDLDLLLVGRETRALPDALAYTSSPFIEGLTWNRDACLAALQSAGIRLKEGGRWRVAAELDGDEKKAVIEAVARFAPAGAGTEATDGLIGYTYTFPREDRRSFLRDGREFATMLNSCGRVGSPGTGMAVCMGDRGRGLEECREVLADYRGRLREYMNVLSSERWRVSDGGSYVMVNAEGLVPETMTGTVSSLLAGSPKNAGKIVIMRSSGEENTVKFSSRKSPGCTSGVNLSHLMRGGAEKFGGIGGGHDGAAGARITKDKLDGFLDYLEVNVANVQGAHSPE